MSTQATPTPDKSARTIALSGAVVVLAAIMGSDCATVHAAGGLRLQKAGGPVVRVAVSSKPTAMTTPAGLGWAATVLLVLILAHPSLSVACSGTDARRSIVRPFQSVIARYRRKFGISHRIGGLYGP